MTGAAIPYPAPSRAWALVIVLLLAGIISSIDRGILNLVVDPVRQDLGISDVQISLLQGLSFSLFYVTVGVPLGLVADRVQRRRLLAIGVTLWSLATIMGAFAPNFSWMFVSRVLVGLGEATLGPCALSMISDSFPAHRRGRPISIHMLGSAVAGGVGTVLVGYVLAQAPLGTFDAIPGARGAAPWRIAFVFAGSLGAIVVALLLLQREPARQGIRVNDGKGLNFRGAVSYFIDNRRVFAPFYLAFASMAIAAYGFIAWAAVLLMRGFGMTPVAVGHSFGMAAIIAGAIGALAAGQIIDMGARGRTLLDKFKLLIAIPLLGLPATLAVFAPDHGVAIVMLCCMTAMFPMITTAVLSVLADLTANDVRGLSVSFVGLWSVTVGGVGGPLLIAAVTQHILRDETQIGHAMLMVGAPALLCSSALYLLSLRRLRQALKTGSSLAQVVIANEAR